MYVNIYLIVHTREIYASQQRNLYIQLLIFFMWLFCKYINTNYVFLCVRLALVNMDIVQLFLTSQYLKLDRECRVGSTLSPEKYLFKYLTQ